MVGPKKQDFWPRINILKGKKSKRIHRLAPVCQKLGVILESKVIEVRKKCFFLQKMVS